MKLKKFLPNKFWTTVFLTVFICLALSWHLFLSRTITLSFHHKSSHDVTYRIYYITRMEFDYRNEDSSVHTVKAGDNDINLQLALPNKSLWKMKMEIENTPSNNIEISDIRLHGKTTNILTPDNLKKSKFYDFAESKVSDKKILLQPRSGHGAIDFNLEGLKTDGTNTVDLYTFLVLALIYTLIIYKFIEYLAAYKNKRGYSRIDIFFLAVFFFILWIPMMDISDADISFKELRGYAKKPVFDIKNLSGYGAKFNEWFSDRFFGRQEFLQIFSINNTISKHGNSRVLTGKDGWYFLKADNSIRNFQNIDLFTEDELKTIAKYLTDFNNWAKANNKDFYYVIAPDKNKIYGEYFSDAILKINPNEKSRANQLVAYLKKNTDIKTLYFYDTLYSQKDKGLSFFKRDTHWNRLGAYLAYKDLMAEITKYHKDIKPVIPYTVNEAPDINPDMESYFPSLVSPHDTTLYKVPEVHETATCDTNMPTNRDISCINSDKTKHKNLIVFRDSFTINMAPYLRNTFGKSRFLWHYVPTPEELKYAKDNADIIILENVERMLPSNKKFNFPKE